MELIDGNRGTADSRRPDSWSAVRLGARTCHAKFEREARWQLGPSLQEFDKSAGMPQSEMIKTDREVRP